MNFSRLLLLLTFAASAGTLHGCTSGDKNSSSEHNQESSSPDTLSTHQVKDLKLPEPDPDHDATNHAAVSGWTDDKKPKAPEGFTVVKFADELKHPRNTYVLPNGDLLVAESDDEAKSANRVTLIRDTNFDGKPEYRGTFTEAVKQPYGLLHMKDSVYIAGTAGVWRFPYKEGQKKLEGKGKKILSLPAGGYNHHWTRNLLASPNNDKIFIAVGSASDHGEYGMAEEKRRANILVINPDGTGEEIYGAGLRNPVGIDFHPTTKELWTSVNERDNLGDQLVPDYLTSVKEDGFYGWPYAYFGENVDPRQEGKRPDLVDKTLMPDVALGSHTSSLGLAFYDGKSFPERYKNGAFIGQHGSWNRSDLAGYKVVFVPFEDGKASGDPEDFLSGFIEDRAKSKVHGRPAGVTVLPNGALLVADDAAGTLWMVQATR